MFTIKADNGITYSHLTQKEQYLNLPNLVIGSVSYVKQQHTIYKSKKFTEKTIKISDALITTFKEILSNACDNIIESKNSNIDPGKIKVQLSPNIISVYNEGKHISTQLVKIKNEDSDATEKIYLPQLIFTNFATSSNYNNKQIKSATYGSGSKFVNLFSKYFKIEIGDPLNKIKYTQEIKNNMSEINEPILEKYHGIGYTKISYILDFDRFNIKEYSEDILSLYTKFCIDASYNTNTTIYINDTKYNYKSIEKYKELFSLNDDYFIYYNENIEILVCYTPDNAKIVSFVNFIICTGVHITAVYESLYKILVKKTGKQLTIGDIKPHFTFIISYKIINPDFSNSTKDELKSPKPKIEFTKKHKDALMKWSVVDRLNATINAKNYKKLKTNKNKIDLLKVEDAHMAGKDPENCTLYITEGDSARTLLIKAPFDRKYSGVMPIRGKFINIHKKSIENFMKNKEVLQLMKVLNLNYNENYTTSEGRSTLRYGKICFATDSDSDGYHIEALLIAFINSFKGLLENGFVNSLLLPLYTCVYKKDTKIFYSLDDYLSWLKQDKNNEKYNITYYKGLGRIDDKQIPFMFENKIIMRYNYDSKANKAINMAFGKVVADRKKWIFKFNSQNKINLDKILDITKFINSELIIYAIEANERSIPSVIDGLKPSQRYILYVGLLENKRMTVNSFAGTVIAKTNYHHGNVSIEDAIINMGRDYIGSNNLPLLEKSGQFGSRIGTSDGILGEDCGASRYISASVANIAKYIFLKEDECLYKYVDNNIKNYYPVFPLMLANGVDGIGMGFSTSIPSFNPFKLIKWCKIFINKVQNLRYEKNDPIKFPALHPWVKGFKGKIYKKDNSYKMEGVLEKISDKIYEITELPIQISIQNYKKKLSELKAKKLITSFENLSNSDKILFKIRSNNKLTLENMQLVTSISLSNLVLISKECLPKKYKNIDDLLYDFCTHRLKKYCKRKEIKKSEYQAELSLEQKRKEFIEGIMDKTIVIDRKNMETVKELMKLKQYPDSFLNIYVRNFTKEKLDELNQKIENISIKLNYYQNTDPEILWLNELNLLESKIYS